MGSVLEYRILGPLEISSGHQPVRLPSPREQRLLAALLLTPGQLMTASELVNEVWGDRPPATARRQVHNGLSRLRQHLCSSGAPLDVLPRSGAGYRLCVDATQVDAHQFRQLIARATEAPAGAIASRARALREALALWRGPALQGLSSPALEAAATHLEEQRLAAYEQCFEDELELGEHQRLIGEISELLAAHPVRERLVGQLMRSLQRSARPAEALHVYQRFARRLADELGVDPGPELRQVHVAILRGELPPATAGRAGAQPVQSAQAAQPARSDPGEDATPGPAERPVPQQLLAGPSGFVGRRHELAMLHAYLDPDPATGHGRLATITGSAGVGKTALALQWSHQVRDRFPDGQLFADLRGYDAERPLPPERVLESFLRALGMAGASIPPDLATRSGWFRSLSAERRMLIVLDNAGSAADVRPLLPGIGASFVVVTSRDRLRGLAVTDGALPVPLGRLSPDEAGHMLQNLLGERGDRERAATAQLLDQCARVPLALRIAAERLRERADRSVAELVAELADEPRRLDLLDAGDDVRASIRAVFSWSHRDLPSGAARLFRLCSLHPGPEFGLRALAALAGADPRGTSRSVDTLVRTHLLEPSGDGRYRLHDLLRVYAGELAAADGEPERRGARSRLLQYYLATAAAAMASAYPYERRPPGPLADARAPDPPWDASEAAAWLDRELDNLLAVARQAGDHGEPGGVVALSATIHRHLRTRGRYGDAEALHARSIELARSIGDRAGEQAAQSGLGHICRLLGRVDQATAHYTAALRLARTTGDQPAEADVKIGLGHTDRQQGRLDSAVTQYTAALQLARAIGDQPSELAALAGLGLVHQRYGWHEQAVKDFEASLRLARAIGDGPGELDGLRGLGWTYRLRGQDDSATEYFASALQVARATGNPSAEMDALRGIGETHRWQGRYAQAAARFQAGTELAHAIGSRTGEIETRTSLGHVQRLQGRVGQAAESYQWVLQAARECGDRNWELEALHGLSRLSLAAGDCAEALDYGQQALDIATELGQLIDQARVHDAIARARRALVEPRQAREHWRQALRILEQLGTEHTEDEETTAPAIRAQLAELGQRRPTSG